MDWNKCAPLNAPAGRSRVWLPVLLSGQRKFAGEFNLKIILYRFFVWPSTVSNSSVTELRTNALKMNPDSSLFTSKKPRRASTHRFKVDFSSQVLFWSDAASSSSDQALWDWTLIGWSWSCSTRRARGTTGTQTRPKTGLCKQPPCGGDAHGTAAVSPKWASKKAALVPAWKYIAVIQDANHVFSMCVCVCVWGGIWAACYSGLLSYNWTAPYRNLRPKHWLHFTGFTPLLQPPCCRTERSRPERAQRTQLLSSCLF